MDVFLNLDHPRNVIFSGEEEGSRKPASAARFRRASQNSRTHQMIMIIEDERLVAENLKLTVEDSGYKVSAIVASGEDAIQKMQSMHIDLILMDITLKGDLDGVETAIIIQNKIRKNTPIVFVTAHSSDRFPQLSQLDPLSYAYVSKPYTDHDLLAAMNRALGKT